MRDLFDEFMEELRRRQADAEGQPPRRSDDRPTDPDEGDRRADVDLDGDETEGGRSPDGAAQKEPTPLRRRRRRDGAGSRIGTWILALLFLALVLFFTVGLDLWTDAIWFDSVGFVSVFWTRVGAQVGLFVGAFVLALAVLLVNLAIADRLARRHPSDGPGAFRSFVDRLGEASRQAQSSEFRTGWGYPNGGRSIVIETPELPDLSRTAVVVIVGLAILAALAFGSGIARAWETILLWGHQQPFGVSDPVFGRDVGFFVFELPFLRLLQAGFNALVLGSLLVAGARYVVAAMGPSGVAFATPIRVHLGVLGGLYLLSVAAGYQLDKLDLVYASHDTFTGVSYADENARFFALNVLTAIAALAAALLVGGAFSGWTWLFAGALTVWFGALLLLGGVYPEVIQRFVVDPSPFDKEERYIGNSMSMTTQAFALTGWQARSYGGESPLTAEQIMEEADTFRSARLWDYRPLGDALDQLQRIRQYYDFVDVDIDRYTIDDTERQVMLSARELAPENIPFADNWLNRRIIYTHGVGLAMVPVNEVIRQGEPNTIIRNLPPVSSDGAPQVTEPGIYFGERPSDYIIVGARQSEFDYPQGDPTGTGTDQGAQTRWKGDTGIPIDQAINRLLFGLRFRDLNFLISDQVIEGSQLLFHRNLGDRLPRIAPFLRYDKDPYLVVREDGGLAWIADAYIVSDRYPNAEPFFPGQLEGSGLGTGGFDYIRNSVKVVVDAYDGTTTFYIADQTDPIIEAYAGVFPSLFRPLAEMPADLVPHLRYPEELFNVQTRMYGRYHVTDPLTFFQGDDVWQVSTGSQSEQSLPQEAYYVLMRMPGETSTEFLLLQPMTPTTRPNMIAWVAARSDQPNYGTVIVYRFPSDTNVFGPVQVDAQIEADPTISSQVTLWNQAGSEVIRGNLIVLPIGDSIVYLQPIYLQSTSTSFPAFQKIVVASPTAVVWADTLEAALRQLLLVEGGESPGPSPSPGPGPSPSPGPGPSPSPSRPPTDLPTDVDGLVAYANLHFQLAQEALRAGDFARYGQEISRVEAALLALDRLTGVVPGASPSAAPSP
jgi:hypothetical protein